MAGVRRGVQRRMQSIESPSGIILPVPAGRFDCDNHAGMICFTPASQPLCADLRVWREPAPAPDGRLPYCAMVTVEFAASLRRHVPCPVQQVDAGGLRSVLEAALRAAPALGHYVFDDQRCVRKHVAVFVNRELVRDRTRLDQTLQSGDTVLVVQALSGG